MSGFLFVPAMLGLMDAARVKVFGKEKRVSMVDHKSPGSPVTPGEPEEAKATAEEISAAA